MITAQRATTRISGRLLGLLGSTALALTAAPAAAQVNDAIVLNIMRECAKIDDPTARLACYDNNIRSAVAAPRAAVPGQAPVPQGGAAPVAGNTPRGFGAETVRTEQPSAPVANSQAREISANVASVSQRGPGIYLLTLEGGAQWQFAEGVGQSYRVPRAGSSVEIERGALGGFLMHFDNQQAVSVRRVR